MSGSVDLGGRRIIKKIFFKQKTAYEIVTGDWSSDVCSSDLASWKAADVCLQTHGGFGFAEEYDIERKFRETRLYQVAPISTNLILSHVATHVLGLPKSF